MCGINGFTFEDQRLIDQMNQRTAHRGPDDTGTFVADGVSLGHNRLSIIDLSPRGHQPMESADKRFVIVFNGEIYNYKDVRKELESQGGGFRSETDTEAILEGYARWGKEVLQKLNGIFALAIYDRRERELFLARDRMGVKPLYYWTGGQQLVFSSEIKAILTHDVPRRVDTDALGIYLRIGYVPAPRTMFEGIKKFPAASCATVRGDEMRIERYWAIPDEPMLSDRAEATERLRLLAEESIRSQLVSDRPVGVFLSGGLDSSAVLGVVREAMPGMVKTFSVGFKANLEEEKYNADFELARQTAKSWGTDHHELVISGKDVADALDDVVWHLDEPVANLTSAAIMLLSRESKKSVAVVLGGDGGDELFGGYPRHALSAFVSRLGFFRSFTRSRALSSRPGAERYLAFHAAREEAVSGVTSPLLHDRRPLEEYARSIEPSDHRDPEAGFMRMDWSSWLPDESLLRTDKMSMAAGLEARVPILDHRMVELSARIPTSWKIRRAILAPWGGAEGKVIWKEAMSRYLPAHILNEPKRGWFSPTSKWLRAELKPVGDEIFFGGNLSKEYFDQKELADLWNEHCSVRANHSVILSRVLMFELWHDQFMNA
ncbi:asparagine synthase (glutamine-hydrolyzing) [Candidatus Kaiserbacteria bacterium RIFCSPHIGHO2_01_FULL_54_36b]|uniref:asparagine synthase (glutamine-hydrolyzing) n=1 Tax=Candidatus Kaiserbacteria bacterium RIFCSPHIGHO2_01_FULL_54_36b TaxID=1798483 RepID=A0A1F6CQR1_9BACT|nr:MAG: asparagine synthase (glutamine-hydrolyzing) [Candidatus Kaiserbacteria bacterium RIFCSPHIGHO2_01_FULL_54_36b]